jgi:hypothetical protein
MNQPGTPAQRRERPAGYDPWGPLRDAEIAPSVDVKDE